MDRPAPNARDVVAEPSSPRGASSVALDRAAAANEPRVLPDVAFETLPTVPGKLDRVGMSGIETVVLLRDDDGSIVRTPARADAAVDLADPHAKGIHMSRLYLALQEGLDGEVLRPRVVEDVLRSFVESHDESSSAAHLGLQFEQMVRRSALLSEHTGWRSYPVRIDSHRRGDRVEHGVSVAVTYSSTCPCSAALARQLMQEGFDEDFAGRTAVQADEVRAWLGGERAVRALPHAQRSRAEVTAVFEDVEEFGILELVDAVELAVETAVQAVVKRVDEQEFARLNALNLMFCEDAARRIRAAVEEQEHVLDFRISVRHLESLHAHDAVAIVTKGVPGGLSPDTRPFGFAG